jgi:putative RNA 2'-phosphotransferase
MSTLAVRSAGGGTGLWLADLLLFVEESDKQRFELSPDATRIRARQGHSVPVVLTGHRRPRPICCITAR